jgi:hypothetical protein
MFAPLIDKLRDEVELQIERVREFADDLANVEDDEDAQELAVRADDVRNAAVNLADWIEDYLSELDNERNN